MAITHEGPIELWDAEAAFLHPDLDFDYISNVADDAAGAIARDRVAEVNYQPGDGTRYRLLLIPLSLSAVARPRVKEGLDWGAQAVDGIERRYGSVVLAWMEHGAYPIQLAARGDLAATYIAEHWNARGTSAVTVAVFLRAVGWHLDRIAALSTPAAF